MIDTETLGAMSRLWNEAAKRPVGQVWQAIVQMSTDPVFVADRIAEAGQKDESLDVPEDVMDAINDLAVNGAAQA